MTAFAEVDYQSLLFEYRPHPDETSPTPVLHPVVVVGAGPVGLALAIDLAQRGQRVVVLDNDNSLSTGSRAICFAKRTLEIFDRLGCGDRMVDKGVSWNVGKVFFRDAQVYRFDLAPEPGQQRPAFINLQQYYVEGYLAERAAALPLIDLRWKSRVVGVEQADDWAELEIETPGGRHRLRAAWVAACDGSRSALRQALGQESKGRVFRDRFLIADVKMKLEQPAERWFWFDPPFHPNQSVLLHMQPDNVWRIDFQLGWDADPDEEKKPENIIPRVQALLGPQVEFTLEWASVYTFACLRMERFRHGRVLFAGDAAHGVSPFGARGANSGIQDADNLGWKLDAVLRGDAAAALLDSYGSEREYAADENILHSTRATDFITPKSRVSRSFRDAVLALSRDHPFARTLVNSGRLSMAATLHDSPLNTPDRDVFEGRMVPGAAAADAPVLVAGPDGTAVPGWLLHCLGRGFTALVGADGDTDASHARMLLDALPPALRRRSGLQLVRVLSAGRPAGGDPVSAVVDVEGLVARRYDLRAGTVVLLRPDAHVCARWRTATAADLAGAIERVFGGADAG